MAPIRVFIVDDHPLIRSSLRDLFASRGGEFHCCGEAGSCKEAVERIGAARPDVVLVDMGLPDDNGFALLRELKTNWPRVGALVFSMHEESKYALRAVKEGALGYLMKTATPSAVMDAVIRVSEGKRVVDESIQQQLLEEISGDPKAGSSPVRLLSSREWQVFEKLGQGQTMREIAEHMKLSEKTVGSFCDRIKVKLGQGRLRDVARMAQEWSRHDPL